MVVVALMFGCGDSDPAPDVGSDADVDSNVTADSNVTDSDVADAVDSGDVSVGDASVPDAPEPGGPGCGLESAAFCETFDTAAPGGPGGDIDEARWAVSRWGNLGGRIGHHGNFARLTASSSGAFIPEGSDTPTLCGGSFSDVPVGEDYRVCDGQLEEVLRDDGNAFTINSMMARQVFDFAGRTGTIAFDVDAKKEGGHGWWIEAWVSEEPQPAPYQPAPTVSSFAKNAIGIMLHGGDSDSCSSINSVFRTQEYDLRTWTDKVWEPESTQVLGIDCIEAEDTVLNHIEIRLSQNRIEIFGSDAGRPETIRSIGYVDNIDLNFERGYVSLQHAHYNAAKSDPGDPGNTPVQTYRWDNIGFDGPVHAPIRAYDAAMPMEMSPLDGDTVVQFGYELPASLSFEGVRLGSAREALLNLSISGDDNFEYRVNSGAWTAYEGALDSESHTAWSIPLPLDALREGTNTIDFRSGDADKIGNVDLSLID